MSCGCRRIAWGGSRPSCSNAISARRSALVGTLAEMYVQGVSTRKVKAVTETLCGHSFSASSISAINKSLDAGLKAFAERRLTESYPYLILDARYEKVREAGVIVSQAVLVAVAVDEDGARSWRSSSPTARAGRAGAIFSPVSRRVASPALSSSSPTTTRG
jgi:transposase-like protein